MENEITGIYPIIFDDMTVGEIAITREGLFWTFAAKCEMRDEIVRLSVFGDGEEGYLGVMEPDGDMLKLTKKLSRTALNSFPKTISHGGRQGKSEYIGTDKEQEYSENPANAEDDYSSPPAYEYDGSNVNDIPPDDNKPPSADCKLPQIELGELIWRPCPCPCSLFTGIEEKKVCSYITGAFSAQEGNRLLLAVPENVALELPISNAIHFIDKIKFSDSIYLICAIDQGKSVSEL